MARSVIDLDRSATILDVADRIGQAAPGDDLVLVGAAGAPWLRSTVFIEVARALAGERRFWLVTSDPRARSLAATVHVPAYASVSALDRQELDATERLDRRRIAVRRPGAAALGPPAITGRTIGVLLSLAAAVALSLAVVLPSAAVTVAPTTRTMAPLDLEIRGRPGGEVQVIELSDGISAVIKGRASGFRIEESVAKGTVRLQNRQTRDIRVPKGTEFRTQNGIRFRSTEDRTLPASIILPLQVRLTIGQVDIPIEAVQPGVGGNVERDTITVSPASNDYIVTNPQPTTGGETKRIPIVEQRDYDGAVARGPGELQTKAEERLARWRTEARAGTRVIPRPYWKATSYTPASEVLKKEVEEFEVHVTGIATAFAVPADEPRKTAIDRLAATTDAGYTLDERSVQYDERLQDDPDQTGRVVWTVRVSGVQLALVNEDQIRRSLAGRGLDEARTVLDRAGVRLVEVRTEPSWWPRIPLLDGRISVEKVPAAATAP